MDKLLTIIIPVYNTEEYLLRCFNSVVHPNVEVIIIDDGSKDNSAKIIDDFCNSHSNFKAIHTLNQGAAQARLTGLKEVKTKYFGFVDSDDIVNINQYFALAQKMEAENLKVGNGRSTVYLPNSNIPFNSRKWQKSFLDFRKDKLEFSNLTCSLWDKIWHIDCAPLFINDSTKVVYEDMEVVYHAIAQEQKLLHTNDVIYNYCMRGIDKNSTSAIGLQTTRSDGLKGLLHAASSMIEKFKESNLYDEYKDELESIIIKLVFQRIFSILTNSEIQNKKQIGQIAFQILNDYLPGWQNNKYYKTKFKGSEYNDFLFYIGTGLFSRLHGLDPNMTSESNYLELLDEYDKSIVLRKS